MRRYSRLVVCLAFGLGLAGCRTGTSRRVERAPDWESPESIAAAEAQKSKLDSTPKRSQDATAKRTLPVINTNVVLTGWVSLENCAPDQRWRVVVSHGPQARASLQTPAGSFLFLAGGTSAFWNGIEVRLGFAPRYENEQMLVNALDIEKTVRPLVLAERLQMARGPVAVIDPGHGGSDPGAHSPSGHLEKEFTLDWARRLTSLLAAKGWQVFSTRTNDADVPLAARVEFAEQHHADLFVSLHFNSSLEGRQQGTETYCFTPCGMKSSMNRGYEDDASATYPNNAFDALNLALAYKVHTAVIRASGSNDRGVRRARFPAVLKNQNRPAILVEGGYISSPAEAERLADPAYREKLAEGVAEAVSGYLSAQTAGGLLPHASRSSGNQGPSPTPVDEKGNNHPTEESGEAK